MKYADLVKKFGAVMAQDIMFAVEKMANVQVTEQVTLMSEEERMQNAYDALDRLDAERAEAIREQQEENLRQGREKLRAMRTAEKKNK